MKDLISVILVCDGSLDTRLSIENLIASHPRLSLSSTVSTQDACLAVGSWQSLKPDEPKLVWLHLAPHSDLAFTVLKELRQTKPEISVLASHDRPDPELIRTAYRLGAADFLDPKNWNVDLIVAIQECFPYKRSRVVSPELLMQPAFWAIHFDRAGYIMPETDSIDGAVLASTLKPYQSPCLGDQCIALPDGYSFKVEYSPGCDQVLSVIFELCNSQWQEPIVLGWGRWFHPVLRWSEVMLISQTVQRMTGQKQDAAAALLLLLPWVWLTTSEDKLNVNFELMAAIDSLAICKPGLSLTLAERLTSNIQCPVPILSWEGRRRMESYESISWREDKVLGWINDSERSTRNPKPKHPMHQPLSSLAFTQIKSMFAALVREATA